MPELPSSSCVVGAKPPDKIIIMINIITGIDRNTTMIIALIAMRSGDFLAFLDRFESPKIR